MKTQGFLQSLRQQLRQWQGQYKALFRKEKYHQKLHKHFFKNILLYLSANNHQGKQGKHRQTQRLTARLVTKDSGIDTVIFRWVHQKRSSIILVLAIFLLTSVIGSDFYNQPRMKVGNIALQTFIAPYTDNIEDKEETELQRKAAIDNSVPVLMIDHQINKQINARLEKILDISNEIRSIVGIFPFLNTSILSPYTQSYLRSLPELEWQKLIGILENNRQQNTKKQNSKRQLSLSNGVSDEAAFLQALSELEAYQFMTTESDFSDLITQISEVRKRYNQGIEKALQIEAGEELKQVYTAPVLLALSDNDWAKTQVGIRKSAERIIAQGIAAGLHKSILHNAVSLQVQLSVPSGAESLAKKVLLAVLRPNLKEDIEQTKQQAQIVAREIPSVMFTVRKGEII
ncbi:MAG: phosphohydrolase, partial [Dolichospermum sp.]